MFRKPCLFDRPHAREHEQCDALSSLVRLLLRNIAFDYDPWGRHVRSLVIPATVQPEVAVILFRAGGIVRNVVCWIVLDVGWIIVESCRRPRGGQVAVSRANETVSRGAPKLRVRLRIFDKSSRLSSAGSGRREDERPQQWPPIRGNEVKGHDVHFWAASDCLCLYEIVWKSKLIQVVVKAGLKSSASAAGWNKAETEERIEQMKLLRMPHIRYVANCCPIWQAGSVY